MNEHIKIKLLKLLEYIGGKILPVIFWITLIFGFDAPYVAVLTIITALIHEFGHIFAIRIFSKRAAAAKGHISGFRIKRSESLCYPREMLILAMGPAFNLAVFVFCLPFGGLLNGYIHFFGIINLATCLSNLIPIEGYDGYGIIYEGLSWLGMTELLKIIEKLSFILTVLFTFLSLYLINTFGNGYWIFFIFFSIMTAKLSKFAKNDIFKE